MLVVLAYLAYLALLIAIAVWVARALHQNSCPFHLDALADQADLADSINPLLVVGFDLIDLGWTPPPISPAHLVGAR
jgi:hypothetical protein